MTANATTKRQRSMVVSSQQTPGREHVSAQTYLRTGCYHQILKKQSSRWDDRNNTEKRQTRILCIFSDKIKTIEDKTRFLKFKRGQLVRVQNWTFSSKETHPISRQLLKNSLVKPRNLLFALTFVSFSLYSNHPFAKASIHKFLNGPMVQLKF